MSDKKCKLLMFSVGGLGYGLLEVIWRGFTHPSMVLAGGICFLGFAEIQKKMKDCALFFKAIAGSALVTTVELIFGIVFNVLLKKNVWDYSRLPLNLGGQICAVYSFIWIIISLIFIPFAGFLSRKLKGV